MSHHSTSLVGDPELKELQDYIGATSWNVLDHMGYDLTNYELFWTEFWVQQFAEKQVETIRHTCTIIITLVVFIF